MIEVYVDGSSKQQATYVIAYQDGEIFFRSYHKLDFLTKKTSNECEYYAVIEGLKFLRERAMNEEASIYSDSELVVKQLNAEYAIKEPRLRELAIIAEKIWEYLEDVQLVYVPREQNNAGKFLG